MADPRTSIKSLLDGNLTSANLTCDDDSMLLNWHVMFNPYSVPLERVFLDKQLDLIFTIGDSETVETVLGVSHKGVYMVTPHAIDKYDFDGNKLVTATLVLWKAVEELRSVFKANPWGSLRSLTEEHVEIHDFGDMKVWSKPCRIEYKTYSA